MKKNVFMILVLVGWSASETLADPIRVTGFEKEDPSIVGISQNCISKTIEAKDGEVIPEGKGYLKVTLVSASKTFMTISASARTFVATSSAGL